MARLSDAPSTKGRLAIPELPEVETVRQELIPWLSKRRILNAARVDTPAGPKYANLERASGQHIHAINRRGKFIILNLDTDDLIIHLGMTGIISPTPAPKHLRAKLELDAGVNPVLYFQDARRFGRFLVVPKGEYGSLPTLAAMGPEPLTDAFNVTQFKKALQGSRVAIKTYLLSQKPVAGVGNIYADEALWFARVHPLTPANKVTTGQTKALVTAIKEVLAASIKAQGTTLNDYRTVNGEVGAYLSELKAYGHEHEPCPRCGDAIERIVIAGRSSHYCPNCQSLRNARA